MAASDCVEIRPAEAIEPPEGSSTVVSFLRVRKPGMAMLSICERLGRIDVGHFGRDAQLDAALREHDRREAEADAIGLLDDADRARRRPVQVSLFGIGIVPPARNFADSPETAVTVGSASVRATPCCSKACRVAVRLWPPPTDHPSVALSSVVVPLMENGFVEVQLGHAVRHRRRN